MEGMLESTSGITGGVGPLGKALEIWRSAGPAWLFACCTGGSAVVSDGSWSGALRPGSLLVVEPDFHGECLEHVVNGCTAAWMIASSRLLKEVLADFRPEFFVQIADPPVHDGVAAAPEIFTLASRLLQGGGRSAPRAASDLLHAAALMLRDSLSVALPSRPGSHHVGTLCNQFYVLLAENIRAHRDVAWYASELCVTPGYLADVVGRHGESPKQAIRRQAVAEMKKLLSTTDMNIDSIARVLNFRDPSYMCKFWKKETGTTLSAYRAALRS